MSIVISETMVLHIILVKVKKEGLGTRNTTLYQKISIDQGSMSAVSKGKRNHHKGWKVKQL
jgi:hypothetical protein